MQRSRIPGLLLLGVFTLCGCPADDAAPKAPPLPFPRDTLIIAYKQDVQSFMSVIPMSGADGYVINAVSTLLVDPNFDCGLDLKPLLAREWSFSPDGKTLSMTLRDDIRWSDSTLVTARDVKFTYDLLADPKVGSPNLSFTQYMDPQARPRVIDDTHIEFVFTQAYDPVTMLSHAGGLELLPEHILKGADRSNLAADPYHLAPVTSGSFKLASREKGQQIVLVPTGNWSGPEDMKPKLAKVIFKILPMYANQIMELEAGTVDMVTSVDVVDADRLAVSNPEISLKRRGWRSMEYVGWNALDPASYKKAADRAARDATGKTPVDLARVASHPIFGDPAVRKALTKAIDVQRLIDEQLTSRATGQVYGRPAVGTITPSLCKAHNDDIKPLPFDPEAAKAELAALGWTDSNNDGVLDKGGKDLRFRLLTTNSVPRRENVGILIQAQLKTIGVDMKLETLDPNAWIQRIMDKDFDATLGGWNASLFVDPSTQWHSGPGFPYNFVSYANPEVDRLIDAGLAEPDPEKVNVIWHDVQRLVYDDQPYTFLYWMDEIVAVHSRFQDVEVDITSPYNRIYRWWVPDDQVKYR